MKIASSRPSGKSVVAWRAPRIRHRDSRLESELTRDLVNHEGSAVRWVRDNGGPARLYSASASFSIIERQPGRKQVRMSGYPTARSQLRPRGAPGVGLRVFPNSAKSEGPCSPLQDPSILAARTHYQVCSETHSLWRVSGRQRKDFNFGLAPF